MGVMVAKRRVIMAVIRVFGANQEKQRSADALPRARTSLRSLRTAGE
jgi:hypothetical protein